MKTNPPFWETKSLATMTQSEWESLCDGCGRCCLVKLQDEDTDEIFATNVACRLLDIDTCRCRDYDNRMNKVAMCMVLEPEKKDLLRLLPDSCAYRRLDEGKGLPSWHPLLTANSASVHLSGNSVKGYAQSEEYIHPDQLPEHVINK
ncbi:MAG: YcgN family cysteine cluster protein [Gammaproteobacteria bacterium]|nr:YcgN family cysteine cluster protein [Gammaproteobacteria bacterium]